jgi:nucleoid-associated protein YgaU
MKKTRKSKTVLAFQNLSFRAFWERFQTPLAAAATTADMPRAGKPAPEPSVQEARRLPGFYMGRDWEPARDCLWNIAAPPRAYNDPFQWAVIYEAHKSAPPRPGEPDVALPGLTLALPSVKGEMREGMRLEGAEGPGF